MKVKEEKIGLTVNSTGTENFTSYLLQENGDYLLQENGDKILLDGYDTTTDMAKVTADSKSAKIGSPVIE